MRQLKNARKSSREEGAMEKTSRSLLAVSLSLCWTLSCACISLCCSQPRKAWLGSHKLNNFQMIHKVRRQWLFNQLERKVPWPPGEDLQGSRLGQRTRSLFCIENAIQKCRQNKGFQITKCEIICLQKICTPKKY